jgi:hypothetical protein
MSLFGNWQPSFVSYVTYWSILCVLLMSNQMYAVLITGIITALTIQTPSQAKKMEWTNSQKHAKSHTSCVKSYLWQTISVDSAKATTNFGRKARQTRKIFTHLHKKIIFHK